MIVKNNIDDIYKEICKQLVCYGNEVGNTVELNNFSFTLTNIKNNVVNVRNISKSYLCGELLWYMTGRNDIDFINKFSGFWGRISDDGVTSNSAYGHILMKRHGFNQIEKIIELLNTDRNSRRAVINLNVPNPNVIETKDEICTIALQFYIRENHLHCTGIMRSNDIWFGLPYDVAFFTELQKYIAKRVKAKLGTYTHFVTSIHVYDRNYNDLMKVIKCKPETEIKLNVENIDKHKYEIEKIVVESTDPKKDVVDAFEKYGGIFEIEKTLPNIVGL